MTKMSLKKVEEKLQNNNISYTKKEIANGVNINFDNGVILQVFNNNNICFSGKHNEEEFITQITDILEDKNEKIYLFAYIAPNERVMSSILTAKSKVEAIKLYNRYDSCCKIISITELTKEELEEMQE